MISNPQNLQPKLTALEQAIINDIAAKHGVTDGKINASEVQIRADIAAAVASINGLVQSENDATQTILDSLTIVNGTLDNNVNAINQHTTSEVDALGIVVSGIDADVQVLKAAAQTPASVINSIQRGRYQGAITPGVQTIITIAAVNMDKAVLITNAQTDRRESLGHDILVSADLISATEIELKSVYFPQTIINIAWQVVEYV